MSLQTWNETLLAAIADSTALTASTTPTSIIPTAAKFTLPANFFYVGRRIRVRAHGRVSNIVTTPGTLTIDLRFGAVVVANGGTMALNIVAKTNVPWVLEWDLTCRAIGSGTSANMMHQGRWYSESVIGAPLPSAGGVPCHMLPNATPAVGTGFDSTTTQAVDLFGTWSLNNANSILTHQYELIALN
jgi:hypothetical protein